MTLEIETVSMIPKVIYLARKLISISDKLEIDKCNLTLAGDKGNQLIVL